MLNLAQRVGSIKPSATIAVATKAAELKSKGLDVINFGPGEPDYNTPEHIKDAGIEAIQKNFTRYTPSSGIPELRAAICKKLQEDNGITYDPSQIVVSSGAKHALYNAVMAVCDPGDEMILPYPCWVSYQYIVELAAGKPVYVETLEKDGFRIDFDALKEKITPKTKAILINSPNNPTGCVYTREDLQAIAELAVKHQFFIISDEIYEKLIYDQAKHFSPASFSRDVKDLTITINGVSKSYAMTGWRIGYAAANSRIAKAMGDIQSHATSNVNSIAQKAAIAALTGSQEPVDAMIEAFQERRNVMAEGINDIPLMSCRVPRGAFYIMGNISRVLGKKIDGRVIENSQVFAEVLLEKARVAVTAGSAFGPEGVAELDSFVRMSYATGMDDIREGLRRMGEFLSKV